MERSEEEQPGKEYKMKKRKVVKRPVSAATDHGPKDTAHHGRDCTAMSNKKQLDAALLSEDAAEASTSKKKEISGKSRSSQSNRKSIRRREKDGRQQAVDDITLAIETTIPWKSGIRNRQIFEFARALKAIPRLMDVEPQELRWAVKDWHKQALPYITTEDFEETWADFLYAWPRVNYPKGLARIVDLLDKARLNPVESVDYDRKELRDLVALCRELHEENFPEPFFLACRTVGALFRVDSKTAWRWLFLLESDGWIQTVEKGRETLDGGWATRYRYLSDEGHRERLMIEAH